jgi:hypothetical protein
MSDNPLAKLDKARAYLEECRSLPEIKKIRDLALAAKEYARAQHLSAESRNYAWEIVIEAERRAAEFLDKLDRKPYHGGRKINDARQVGDISNYQQGLEQIGISTQDASRWRAVAEIPASTLSRYVEAVMDDGGEATTKGLLSFASARDGSAQVSSDGNEYYTLAEHIEAARSVLSEIDLDPASHAAANKVVKAKKFYTRKDDGLAQEWRGRVWLNPPWGDEGPAFVAKLVESYEQGSVTAAILLVNAHATDTRWFQPLWNYLLCFSCPRIQYWQPDGGGKSPNSGSVFVYLGGYPIDFHQVFSQFGAIVRKDEPHAGIATM